MNEVWNLDPIYQGFADPKMQADLNDLSRCVKNFKAFTETLDEIDPAEGLPRGILLEEELLMLAQKLIGYAALRQSVDTTNSEAGSKIGEVLGIYSESAAPYAAFCAWIARIPNLNSLIEQDALLQEYRFFLETAVVSSRHLLSGIGEDVMAKMQLSGSRAWAELHQHLTSTVPVHYRGETLNLPAVRNLAYDADPQVRRDAYEAELACYKTIQDPVAFAMNSLKLETLNECSLRGYDSPLDMVLEKDFVRRETLDAMLTAIYEFLPKFRQYLKAKAKALGHSNGLPWYDLFAPMGKSSSKFSPQETREYLVELFNHFDAELSQMVGRAFDESWIDFYPRPGKSGGAFCEGVACLEQSRIMTNFDGTISSVVVLAHELGHAFHNQCIWAHRPLNRDYSMPVAETASTFNECVVMNKAVRDAADDAEKLALLETQMRDVTQIMVDILSRYLFETAVFEKRGKQFMDAETLCGMMLDAQKKTYGDGLDENFMHPYMWITKSHYYGDTFYNFPYAFGGLFARGLYAKYEQEGEAFLPKYKQLLYTTPVATAEETAKVAGIDLSDIGFWRSALQIVANKIDLFCQLAETVQG